MLSKSNINPFDSQEAKPYKNDPEIIAMTRLRYFYTVLIYFFQSMQTFISGKLTKIMT